MYIQSGYKNIRARKNSEFDHFARSYFYHQTKTILAIWNDISIMIMGCAISWYTIQQFTIQRCTIQEQIIQTSLSYTEKIMQLES